MGCDALIAEAARRRGYVADLLAHLPGRCLGLTNRGWPRHPLFVPAVRQLEPYPPNAQQAT